jgi:hypothetical protein
VIGLAVAWSARSRAAWECRSWPGLLARGWPGYAALERGLNWDGEFDVEGVSEALENEQCRHGSAGFEPGDGGLGHAGSVGELRLAPAVAFAELPDGAAEFVGEPGRLESLAAPGSVMRRSRGSDQLVRSVAIESSSSAVCSSARHVASARRARSTCRSSRVRVLWNTVRRMIRRPAASQ